MNKNFDAVIFAAQKSGKILNNYFGSNLKIHEKSTIADFFTKADLVSEKNILKILHKYFPTYNIHSEEKGIINKKSPYIFIIDPLDGSNNFVLGIPMFSVCIALVKEQELIFSVIHLPFSNQTYFATKKEGAFLDGKKIRVNNNNDIARITVAYNCNYLTPTKESMKISSKIDKNAKRLLWDWSPAFDFCLLAAGKIEAIINNNCEIYDFAAGKLLASEAGAKITDFKNNIEKSYENSVFLATNGTGIHQKLLNWVT